MALSTVSARDEPKIDDAELPRFAPLEPGEALKSFKVLDGFRVELMAAEPMVSSPVAMAFDEDGRLYVVEMRDYSEHDKESLGRVRLLEDTDGDGRYDKATVFAEGLSWPTAVACWDGGVFVGAAPDIVYLKDTDGDGRADVRKVVFTGFGRSNVQGLFNTFLWGLDHRIHGQTSSSGGQVRRADQPGAVPVDVRGRDFAFDPRTLEFTAVTGGGQHGQSFDDWGVRFVCSNSDHLQMIVDEVAWPGAPPLAPPPMRVSIAADGPQAQVFRISPVEPWRVLRTRLRVSGQAPGPVEGGGRAAGYFTGSTGLTVYRGDAWPVEFRGQVFVADVGSNLIHRKRLESAGILYKGVRIDPKKEFLASTDTWFRPVQMCNGPDGNLWVIDMYREVIEHPASLPPAIKKHLDLDSGRERGRIYRVVHDGATPRTTPRLSAATTEQLVALLAHPNAWHRETAARLLYQRRDGAAIVPLKKLAAGPQPLGRLHALYALESLKALKEPILLAALEGAPAGLQEHVAVLLRQVPASTVGIKALEELSFSGADLRVRWRALQSLGGLGGDTVAFTEALDRDGRDPWVRYAAIAGLGEEAASALQKLLVNGGRDPAILEALASRIGAGDVDDALSMARASFPLDAAAVARGLSQKVDKQRLEGLVQTILPECLRIAGNPKSSMSDRVQAIHALSLGNSADVIQVLGGLLEPNQPPAFQEAAVVSLDAIDGPQATGALLAALPGSRPALRARVLNALMGRSERVLAMLDACESGKLSASQIDPEHRARLTRHPDKAIRARAGKLFTANADRAKLVEAYRNRMQGLRGDPSAGARVFAATCATCHKVGEVGVELGPNLLAFAPRGPEAIVLNVLDPNREVNPQYINFIVTTRDGRSLSGLVTAETDAALTLRGGGGLAQTVPREQIASMISTGQSLMPEGLEATVDPQGMVDLIEFLSGRVKESEASGVRRP